MHLPATKESTHSLILVLAFSQVWVTLKLLFDTVIVQPRVVSFIVFSKDLILFTEGDFALAVVVQAEDVIVVS